VPKAKCWKRSAGRCVALAAAILLPALCGCVSTPRKSQDGFAGWAFEQPPDESKKSSAPANLPITVANIPIENPARTTAIGPAIAADIPPNVPLVSEEPKPIVEEAKTEIAEPAPESSLKPKAELRGRIQAESITVNQSPSNKAAVGNIDNAFGFRRARLGAQGTIGDNTAWVAEFDFAGGNIAFRDVYAEVTSLPFVRRIRVGHFKQPFSEEGQESSNDFPFVERSPIMALDPSRDWGVGFFSYSDNERATFSAGAFRSGTSNNSGNDFGDGNNMAYTLRMTGLPWSDSEQDHFRLLHLGAAFSQTSPKNDTVTINSGPQSSLLPVTDNPGSPFVPQIVIPASQFQLYNLEWSLVLGSLCLQAEWSAMNVDQIGGGPVFLNGWYGFASYFLTGEHREYNGKDGWFGTPHVLSPFVTRSGKPFTFGGIGAWELLARVDYANFESPNMPLNSSGQVQGNRLWQFDLGVNWYLNDYFRIMFDYTHAVPIIPTVGSSDADAFTIRTSIWW
jgi:phosphate-selective porin OprO/OprP